MSPYHRYRAVVGNGRYCVYFPRRALCATGCMLRLRSRRISGRMCLRYEWRDRRNTWRVMRPTDPPYGRKLYRRQNIDVENMLFDRHESED